jgi:hypothetical protein
MVILTPALPPPLSTTLREKRCFSSNAKVDGRIQALQMRFQRKLSNDNLRKHPDKSLEPKGVPDDFEPEVIDETDEGAPSSFPLDHRRELKSLTNR